MINKFLVLLIGIIIISTPLIKAQNVDPSKVDVNELNDQQVMTVISEMEKRGLSEAEAISVARLRGMSNSQISLLQKRIQEVKQSGGVSNYNQENSLEGENATSIFELSEKSVLDSTMVDEKIFGFSFFNNTNLTFEPSVNIPVSDDYIIGAGDEINIDVWGASQQSYSLVVNTNGDINIPLIGPVYLSGLTLKAVEGKVKNKLSLIYSDLINTNPRTFASVSIGKIKAIRINLLGEVFAPGTYTVPGTASLFNVLYLSGGPNKQGSFRDIRLIRNGKIVANLDVYDYIVNGNSLVNVPLMDNDVVIVPPYINRVKVDGEFKRTGIFESKDDETVADMIKYAGGFTESAYKSTIKLYGNNGKEKIFKEVIPETMSDIYLHTGDRIFVDKILDRYKNIVTIKGAVFNPGDFEFVEGLTLKQLINKADGLIENAFLNRGRITRLKEDYTPENISFDVSDVISGKTNIILKANDQIIIKAIDSIREKQTVAIWGEVQNMGTYTYSENLTLADLVFMAGGLKETASQSTIEIRRKLSYEEADKSTDKNSELFYFKISRDLKIDTEANSFILKPYDVIAVRFMPGAISSGSVTIAGEVMYGGIYNLTSDKERISDIMKRAGGLSDNAYPEGASLTRKVKLSEQEKAKREELMEMDSTVRFSELDFEVVSVKLEKIIQNPGSKDDIYMRDGDFLSIPSVLQTVKVSGEVLNPSSTVFEKSFSVKQYINQSGGFSLNAKKGKTYVLQANGSSQATKGFLFFRTFPKVAPGSEIIIPKRPEREGLTAQAWIGIGSAITSVSLMVVTLVNKM